MKSHPLCKPWEHHLSRRRLLGAAGAAASLGLGAISRQAWAAELQQRRKQVLFIWIDGGISQLESWDPKPGSAFGGPFRDIATSVPDIRVSELLPKTARQMHHRLPRLRLVARLRKR